MLASNANHLSTAKLNCWYFSSGSTEAHAGLGCDSCGNDTQIKLHYVIPLENVPSSLPRRRKALWIAIDFNHKPQKARPAGRYLCVLLLQFCCCGMCVVEFTVHPTGTFIQLVIILSSDSSVIIYQFFPHRTSLAWNCVFLEISQTHNLQNPITRFSSCCHLNTECNIG